MFLAFCDPEAESNAQGEGKPEAADVQTAVRTMNNAQSNAITLSEE
jgi:hypothetical protein